MNDVWKERKMCRFLLYIILQSKNISIAGNGEEYIKNVSPFLSFDQFFSSSSIFFVLWWRQNFRLKKNMMTKLTQKYSDLNSGIRVCDAPTWCRKSKNASSSSRPRIPSSSVSITLFACSANSSDDACCSLVLSSRKRENSSNNSECSSNSLGNNWCLCHLFHVLQIIIDSNAVGHRSLERCFV